MSKDRAGNLELRIRNESRLALPVRVGLELPPAVGIEPEDQWVQLPPDHEWSRLAWPCVPARRGRFAVRRAHLEARSAFGSWAARKAVPAAAEIRVYPNLLADRRNLAALFLQRGMFGLHAQRQVGKGREFEQLRDYLPGDSFEDIDWKATARRRHPVTRIYQVEKAQEIYLVLDASRLSTRSAAYGPLPTNQREQTWPKKRHKERKLR